MWMHSSCCVLSTTPSYLAPTGTLIHAITVFPNKNEMSPRITVPLPTLHYSFFPGPGKTRLTRKCLKLHV